MIIHDISRDTINTPVYDGDPETRAERIKSIENGDGYNLTEISMSVNSGTHIDAPLHFYDEGSSIDNIRLNTFFGKCTVISVNGILTGEDMEKILPFCCKKILFKGVGEGILTLSAVFVMGEYDVEMVGTENASIAYESEEYAVHRELALKDILIIENLDLSQIDTGSYILAALPLKIEGAEAAPTRAILLEQELGL